MLTTSPPPSVHLVGAAVKQATGARWVADLRDSLVAHPHRDASRARRAREGAERSSWSRGSSRAAPTRSSRSRRRSPTRCASSSPRGPVVTIANGSDFDDFAGLEYHRGERFRITHAGSFFGKRDPRPFLTALARVDGVVARFVGDFRSADREWAESLGLGDRLELDPVRAAPPLARAPARLGGAAAPDPRGRRPRPRRPLREGVRVPRGRAADPRARAARRRRRGAARARRAPASSSRPTTSTGIARELAALRDRWRAGGLDGTPLSDEWRERLSRRARVEELADLLERHSHEDACGRLSDGACPQAGSLTASARRLPPGVCAVRRGAAEPRTARMRRVTSFLFLATVFCCTFEKVHWNVAGAVGLADVLAILFLLAFAIVSRPRLPLTSAIVLGFFAAFLVVYLAGFFNLETHAGARPVREGAREVRDPLLVPRRRRRVARAARAGRTTGARSPGSAAGWRRTRPTASSSSSPRGAAATSTRRSLSPLTGGASQINIYGAVEGAKVYRPNALTGDPNHLGIMLIVPLLVLTPIYLRLERGHRLRDAARAPDRVPAPRRDRRRCRGAALLGLGVGRDRARDPVPPLRALARAPLPARRRARRARRDRRSRGSTSSRSCSARGSRRAAARSRRTSRSTSFVPQILHRTRCSGSG